MNNQLMDRMFETVAPTQHPRIHFVDIENLIGAGKFGVEQVIQVRNHYLDLTHAKETDLFVIGAGPHNSRAVYEGWGHATYTFRKGPDGADNALKAVFSSIEHPEQFTEVFLASGDGGLEPIAQATSDAGVPLTIVAKKNNCNTKLKQYQVIYLDKGSN